MTTDDWKMEIDADQRQTIIGPDGAPLQWHCCFCKMDVEQRGFDVSAVLLITNWDGPEQHQRVQQWPCHARCLEKAIGMEIEILSDDYRS